MNKTIFYLLAAVFVFLIFGQDLNAQSLSDLNVGALDKMVDKSVLSNPFAEGVSTAEDLTIDDLVLFGVVRNQRNAYALISGYLVEENDKIAGFRVESIDKGKVVLKRLDETYVLTMGGL